VMLPASAQLQRGREVDRQRYRRRQAGTRVQRVLRAVTVQIERLGPVDPPVARRRAVGVQRVDGQRARQAEVARRRGRGRHRHVAHFQGRVAHRGAHSRRRDPRYRQVARDRHAGDAGHHHRGAIHRQRDPVQRRAQEVRRAVAVRVHIHRLPRQRKLRRAADGHRTRGQQRRAGDAAGQRQLQRGREVDRQRYRRRQAGTRVQRVLRAVTVQIERLRPVDPPVARRRAVGVQRVDGQRARQAEVARRRGRGRHRHVAHFQGRVAHRGAHSRRRDPRYRQVARDRHAGDAGHHHRGAIHRQRDPVQRRAQEVRRAVAVRIHIHRLPRQRKLRRAADGHRTRGQQRRAGDAEPASASCSVAGKSIASATGVGRLAPGSSVSCVPSPFRSNALAQSIRP
jgi:hypothetical protein